MNEQSFYPQVQILHICIVFSLWADPIKVTHVMPCNLKLNNQQGCQDPPIANYVQLLSWGNISSTK
jgi:hypothetical protein